MNTIIKLLTVTVCGLALSACGGDGSSDTTSASGTSGNGSTNTGTGSSGSQTSYTVTPSVNGGNGAISPSTAVSVQSGATTSFTLRPASGYNVITVSGSCGGSLASNDVYTTKAVTANCTVVAAFALGGSAGGSALTPRYEALTSASDSNSLLSLLNTEGAKGFRYLGDVFYGSSAAIFVNDGAAPSYTYELLSEPGSASDLVSQANTEGAKGYRYDGPNILGSLYRKDSGSSATYTYVAASASVSDADFLAQLDGQGQSGYWFYGPTDGVNLYMKNNASNSTYTYEALPDSTNLLADLNNEGARGYRLKGDLGNIGWLYVQDQKQTATFTYTSATSPTSSADFITQANTFGVQGYSLINQAISSQAIYFQASNCSGFLCTTLNPLIQN